MGTGSSESEDTKILWSKSENIKITRVPGRQAGQNCVMKSCCLMQNIDMKNNHNIISSTQQRVSN